MKVFLAACFGALLLASPIAAHSYSVRSLSDQHLGTTKAELTAQSSHSTDVLDFFSNHQWMRATRHSSCRSVPWKSTCSVARSQLKLHRWLKIKANHRLQRYAAPAVPAGTVSQIICAVFGSYCSQALAVARCESGLSVNAQNGQYLGLFQMGDYARSAYGHGGDALTQARAAYAYFAASGHGWGPWQCKP